MNGTTLRPQGRKVLLRSVFTLVATAAVLAVGVSEGSARTRHHRSHHPHVRHTSQNEGFLNANAAIPAQTSGRSFSGMASYYGSESGSRTASGQRMNSNAMTAAHRSLPFGTKLRVTHGGRSVVVTINDRGPFIKGRVLDLSTGAARAIGLTSAGVGRVTAEVVG